MKKFKKITNPLKIYIEEKYQNKSSNNSKHKKKKNKFHIESDKELKIIKDLSKKIINLKSDKVNSNNPEVTVVLFKLNIKDKMILI